MPEGELGPVLGLDLGEARIGVAISDPEGRVAVPIGTVKVGQPPGELRAIADLVRAHGVRTIVVGLPLLLSGESGASAEHARAFAATLGQVIDVPIVLHDERLSTVQAERALRDAGVRGTSQRDVVDRSAATVILQAYLDTRPGA